MDVDRVLIEKVARVARLNLTEPEKDEFLPQLRQVLDTFSKINDVDTKGVEPSYHPVNAKGRLRDDKIRKSITSEDALKNSKNNKDGYFKGPRIL
jgi:aspartyl-tRNA(Asn)/glutamyl-tRNA(Gln) amidotransferase subunit C